MCNTRSAFETSSNVDLNEDTKSWGRSVINPIVSSIIAFYPEVSFIFLAVVDKV